MGVPRAAQALAPRAWQPSRVPRCWFRGVPERYVGGTDTRGRQEGRPYNSRLLRSAQSRKRVTSFVVAVTPRREFMKYPDHTAMLLTM
jgi:hypothetical protein